jgi:hypothetical protein
MPRTSAKRAGSLLGTLDADAVCPQTDGAEQSLPPRPVEIDIEIEVALDLGVDGSCGSR